MERPRLSRRTLLVAGAAAAAAGVLPPAPAHAERPGRYAWTNVPIGGGGGFVPGIVFSETERDLIYARTDIGGAYRWDKRNRRWIALLDHLGWDQWSHTGVASVATDPVDPDRVYLAVGTYTNDWDPNNGAVLRSRDRGKNWKTSPLPFKLGGNMPGRGMGERLAIDPNRPQTLYLAAPSGEGLWRSTDSGATWRQVTSFPNVGDYAPDPNDTSGYNSAKLGVLWVVFDPRTGDRARRKATRTIYVGVGDKENILYRSTDAGRTWERVAGQPTGYLPHKGVFDADGGFLYLATSDTAGPYDGAKGDVWKLDTATGRWTAISPVPSASATFGYSGLTIDRQNPSTLMVATQISWWPDVVFFRSTDGGASWTRAWNFGAYPERVNRYDIDISEAPWLTWNASPPLPEQTPKLGWMTESVEIDPFDSDRLLYGTGATIYGTENLTAWDHDETVHISVHAVGVEETAVLDLVSPPSGAHLISAVADVGGFVHTDLNRPTRMFANPTMGTTTSVDFAGLAPNVIARVGNPASGESRFGISTDGGTTWRAASTDPAGANNGGTVAVGARGTRFVWAPGGADVSLSVDGGASWTASTGVPAGARVEADRMNPLKFYAVSGGVFHLSTDGGATFRATGAVGLPATGNVRFDAVPGVEGDVWLAGGSDADGVYGLWHSTNSGASFTRVRTVGAADAVGFGRAARGRSYPAVFISAEVRGVRGIFRSDDAGRSWLRINDDRHQYAWTGAAITGDPRVHGRVYVATNGRGIIRGEPRG